MAICQVSTANKYEVLFTRKLSGMFHFEVVRVNALCGGRTLQPLVRCVMGITHGDGVGTPLNFVRIRLFVFPS